MYALKSAGIKPESRNNSFSSDDNHSRNSSPTHKLAQFKTFATLSDSMRNLSGTDGATSAPIRKRFTFSPLHNQKKNLTEDLAPLVPKPSITLPPLKWNATTQSQH
eukprot:TRINITY_DN2754_c0_g1_i1.p1 TRINITY_DN2754_c0_g1~~TRINITY_DN2754_c0_g1_i1.p1  ORF type:complete len:106 (-),score=1.13 TRINITY_DN2754_c0_g1_i1:337-654(-)